MFKYNLMISKRISGNLKDQLKESLKKSNFYVYLKTEL